MMQVQIPSKLFLLIECVWVAKNLREVPQKKKKDHALFRRVNKTIPDDTVVTTPIYHAHKILS